MKLQETLSRTASRRVWKGVRREIQVMRSQPVSESGFLGEFVSAASALPQPSTSQDFLPWLSDGISVLMGQMETSTLIAV